MYFCATYFLPAPILIFSLFNICEGKIVSLVCV
jgi:hypothetical protein